MCRILCAVLAARGSDITKTTVLKTSKSLHLKVKSTSKSPSGSQSSQSSWTSQSSSQSQSSSSAQSQSRSQSLLPQSGGGGQRSASSIVQSGMKKMKNPPTKQKKTDTIETQYRFNGLEDRMDTC